MAYQIPYNDSTFVIPDEVIPGNSKAADPVIFHLSPAQGPDQARLKSIIFATLGVSSQSPDWSKEIQDAVIAAYGRGADVFVRTVDKVEGLTVPGKMAKRAMVIPPDKADTVPDDANIPIRSGSDFALISGFVITMSFQVACEIARITRGLEDTDPRFFARPSGSPSTETADPTPTTAGSVRKRRGKRATAA